MSSSMTLEDVFHYCNNIQYIIAYRIQKYTSVHQFQCRIVTLDQRCLEVS